MDARAARVHAALQLQHSLEALRADFDARFGDLAEKRTAASDAPSQLWAYVERKHSHGAVRRVASKASLQPQGTAFTRLVRHHLSGMTRRRS